MFVEIRFWAIQHTTFFDFPIVSLKERYLLLSVLRYSLLAICFLEDDFSLVEQGILR